ncbi:MAG: 3-deoxy-7-phosphoheptulonate synthase [Planctomycetia bacterium]|nr:3-deoxy-7-phosphoheptulonate synthase [Planctomycetia bacterium]
MRPTQDIYVRELVPLPSPRALKDELPMSETANRTVVEAREAVRRILVGDDKRLLVIVGPCSIHDHDCAVEYAQRLRRLASRVAGRMLLVMRVYFEKPRTTVGWKGLINDPHLDDTFDISYGMRLARQILREIADLEVPAASEMLEPITPQYLADLIAWASIGARTTESPTHRQMASGLSMPVGFKNGTDGSLQVAIDATIAARSPHAFLGIDPDGRTCIVHTKGNPWGHLILRGGRSGPNYMSDILTSAAERLIVAGLSPRLLVDCSHANSDKDYRKQCIVWNDVINQRASGNEAIIGLMLESNLEPGNQKLAGNPSQLKRGVSITDGCVGWEETEGLILDAYGRLS